MMAKRKSNKRQPVVKKAVNKGYTPIERPVRVKGIKDARRLLSRLIYQLQVGEIDNRLAKDLCYLCICYVNIIKDFEIEQRLNALEEKAGVS